MTVTDPTGMPAAPRPTARQGSADRRALAGAGGRSEQLEPGYFATGNDGRDRHSADPRFDLHRTEGLALAESALRASADDAAVLSQVASALLDLGQDPRDHLDRAAQVIERATAR
jgi:hypothetical protein